MRQLAEAEASGRAAKAAICSLDDQIPYAFRRSKLYRWPRDAAALKVNGTNPVR